MADFCEKCSVDAFGYDYGDFHGITTKEDTKNGVFANVLCGGCGSCMVDHMGVRVDEGLPS